MHTYTRSTSLIRSLANKSTPLALWVQRLLASAYAMHTGRPVKRSSRTGE
jgi:hypothetical protein